MTNVHLQWQFGFDDVRSRFIRSVRLLLSFVLLLLKTCWMVVAYSSFCLLPFYYSLLLRCFGFGFLVWLCHVFCFDVRLYVINVVYAKKSVFYIIRGVVAKKRRQSRYSAVLLPTISFLLGTQVPAKVLQGSTE